MTAIAIDIDEKTKNFISNLNKAVGIVKISGRLFAIYPILTKIILDYNKILKSCQSAILTCDRSCKDPTQCAERFYKHGIEIRNNLLILLNYSNLAKFLLPFRHSLENAATAWDDFVEDCSVASDSELNELLGQIAHVA